MMSSDSESIQRSSGLLSKKLQNHTASYSYFARQNTISPHVSDSFCPEHKIRSNAFALENTDAAEVETYSGELVCD